ncbi:MAG: Mu-like prophage major head subunit gpT family protein [Rhodobacter sp.]|nr:Mu-like prophage major head subunit gpT family protein [Rhodobacter sp.]
MSVVTRDQLFRNAPSLTHCNQTISSPQRGSPITFRRSELIGRASLEEAALKLLNSGNGSDGETDPWKGTAQLIVAPWLA